MTMRLSKPALIISATALSVIMAACVWHLSDSRRESLESNNMVQSRAALLEKLGERDEEKASQAAALYNLAGGKKMLSQKASAFGDKALEEKNKDALSILSKFFGQKQGTAQQSGPKSDQHGQETNRGRKVVEHKEASSQPPPTQEQAEDSEPPGGEETPNEALQGLIAGWSGAGWWQPCAEVCRPRIGTKHTKANFQVFTTCEHKCRQTKTKRLKQVMAHISSTVRIAAKNSPKELAPHTIQKLSKHLIKWAESNGLPKKLGTEANTNLADNEKVGESISGMLIAGWSGAGWWKPCGEVCRPGPGTKHTKANFDKFMACENTCRQNKAEYLQAFLSPKGVVKALAHAKQVSNSSIHAAAAPPAHAAAADHTPAKVASPTPSPQPIIKHEAKAAVKVESSSAAAPPTHTTVEKPAEHLTKQQKLIKWAEAHGLPKSLADNPADKTKVKDIIARMKADRAVERIKEQMAHDTSKVSDVVRGADPAADAKTWLNTR